jgi:allophanate hydrolase
MGALRGGRGRETERSTIDCMPLLEAAPQGLDPDGLRRAYTDDRVTPAEVVESVLARITARGNDRVWISTVPPELLHERAAELRRRRAELDDLPLYGVPFAVKDNIDVDGLATTAACPDFGYLPRQTAPVVARLLDAGAMLVGKTNLDQFATGLTGTRSPYGACESVFGGGLIAGGSSSGSAVAVAAGLVSFALGTDTAGSGRVPAALNGIVGLKPTRGLLSTAGVVPACRSLDCVSIFTAEVPAAAAVFEVARGFSPGDPWGRPLPAAPASARMPRTLRLGIPDGEGLTLDDGQRTAFATGRDRVAGLVASTAPVPMDPLYEAGDLLYRGPWVAERLTALGDFLRRQPDSVLPVTRQVLEAGWRYDAVDAFRGLHRLQELRAWAGQLWRRVDAILLPTVGTTFTHAEIEADPVGRNLALGRYTQFANLLDMAVVTVPNGVTPDGRPASLSLIGPAFSDHTLLRAAVEIGGTP